MGKRDPQIEQFLTLIKTEAQNLKGGTNFLWQNWRRMTMNKSDKPKWVPYYQRQVKFSKRKNFIFEFLSECSFVSNLHFLGYYSIQVVFEPTTSDFKNRIWKGTLCNDK